MPVGLIFTRWNELAGNEILAKFPEDIDINNRTLMQVFNTHEYTGERGMISLMVGQTHIASYYTGTDTNYCILIILEVGEDPDDYEGSLADISQILLQNVEGKEYIKLIPSLYQRLSDYPLFNNEQQLINIYQNEIKRGIINRLRDDGAFSKSELISWLKFKYSKGYGDINLTLYEFLQKEIIQIFSVKNERSVIIFLINDLIMFRHPPFQLLKKPSSKGLPKSHESLYKYDCNKFFQNYKISEKDNIRVIDALSKSQVYNLFKLLRGSFLSREDIEKLGLYNSIKLLIDAQIIKNYQDEEGNDFYALITDFLIELIIPRYILNVIKTYNDNKSISEHMLIKYLNLLEEIYNSLE